jgi:hypothetical protein
MEQYLNDNGVQWRNGQLVGEIDIVKIRHAIKEAKTDYRTPTSVEF